MNGRQNLPMRPHQFPETEVMKLRKAILRMPRPFIPNNGIINMSLHKFISTFEEQEPNAVWLQLVKRM